MVDKKLQRQIAAIKAAVAAAQARINAKREILRKKLALPNSDKDSIARQLSELNQLELELQAALDKIAITIEIATATTREIEKRAKRKM